MDVQQEIENLLGNSFDQGKLLEQLASHHGLTMEQTRQEFDKYKQRIDKAMQTYLACCRSAYELMERQLGVIKSKQKGEKSDSTT